LISSALNGIAFGENSDSVRAARELFEFMLHAKIVSSEVLGGILATGMWKP
jgi:hypothetical protein